MGLPRQPQVRQKSTTAAAAALLTDQVVLKAYRKVCRRCSSPGCGRCWGCSKYPGNSHFPMEHRRGRTDLKCQGIGSLLLTHHTVLRPNRSHSGDGSPSNSSKSHCSVVPLAASLHLPWEWCQGLSKGITWKGSTQTSAL